MDRNQKVEKIANWDGRVSKISNLVVKPRYVNSDYTCEPCDGTLTDTGKHNASKGAIRKFKNNKDGYGGHHTNRTTDPDTRIFDVKIELPEGVIFDGEVSFSNTYEVKVPMHGEGKMSVG
jgi:hypothetical protein